MSPNQIAVLRALSDGPMLRTQLINLTDIKPSTIERVMSELRDDDLIMRKKTGTTTTHWSITDAGIDALARLRWQAVDHGQVVRARTISKLTGLYAAPAWMTRNNGHTHINSLGVRC